MFGAKQNKIEEYRAGVIALFQDNEVSVNGQVIPFRPNDFTSVREFLRAAVASVAFHKYNQNKKKLKIA